ncbi:hypothetical protein AGOR_G00100340 [Albula goreensis]|uniref:Uncharacterized protein n=1 Tax=Albula goreensis TaxID=1534307 RepID=A0A8T3DRQ3_9TELE|nr:hypothetical protein AGOR_G00100340 [Albula goreensis]
MVAGGSRLIGREGWWEESSLGAELRGEVPPLGSGSGVLRLFLRRRQPAVSRCTEERRWYRSQCESQTGDEVMTRGDRTGGREAVEGESERTGFEGRPEMPVPGNAKGSVLWNVT